jgi:predicted nucleotidyltransferase component of viral defense system
MIPESIMGRVAYSAGIQDQWLVTLDVLSVYLLEHLNETGMLNHMCFKGGISLRKVFARIPSRFSRDVDFVDASYQQLSDAGLSIEDYYYKLLDAFDGQTIHDIHWKVKPLIDEELAGDSLRVDLHFFIYDDRPAAGWENRADNVLSFECSFRRPILLPTQRRELREESWFNNLEFVPSPVPVLQAEEAISEKVRAAFQRNNPRDIFDLYQYGQVPFDEQLVRMMSVMKCWQDRGLYDGPKNFDPIELLDKLKVDNYAWERLKSQVSQHAWIDPAVLVKSLRQRFSFIAALTQIEQVLCDDRARRKSAVHDELWTSCKSRHDDRR